ncbi:hypothetical protein [Sphingobium vermicomposti]|uniref:Uncharacterized protein n=1 Tax=Sphingobium vermicomposti TaxID=529005 RepID=A0A846M450_9SPHN|nr:hypothetical protein [Sphingobium vermicomposti]NIJ16987.1 hypothetical protein [Sphingobium vermicomposti]
MDGSNEKKTTKRAATRRTRGRPTKREEILANMAVVFDPSAIGKIVFDKGATTQDLIQATGLEAKLNEISRKITERLEGIRKDAESLSATERAAGGSFASLRSWADDEVPGKVIHRCELQSYSNERVIAALLAHLVEHVVIGEELRSISHAARRRAADELRRFTLGIEEFAIRLSAAGVVDADVRKMSKKKLAAVIALIKDVSEDEAMEALADVPMDPFPFPEFDVSSLNGDSGGDEGQRDEPKSGYPSFDHKAEHDDGVRGAGYGSVPAFDAPKPTPKNRWDYLNLTALGYRIEEADPSTDADMEALQMKLPEVSTIREIAMPRSPEMMMVDGIEGQKDRIIFDRFVRRYCERTGLPMSEMEKRALGLLLVDLPSPGPDRNLGRNGWYHGIVLPGVSGSNRVRRVVSIDQSPEALSEAFSL